MFNKKFKNRFYFFTCILPKYLAHDMTKEFWKNSYFENMRAGFLRVVKIHFGGIALKWCILMHEKKCFWLTLCCSFWSNKILDTPCTSKWPSEPQFCERYLSSCQKMATFVEKWQFLKLKFSVFFLPKLKIMVVKTICDLCHIFLTY